MNSAKISSSSSFMLSLLGLGRRAMPLLLGAVPGSVVFSRLNRGFRDGPGCGDRAVDWVLAASVCATAILILLGEGSGGRSLAVVTVPFAEGSGVRLPSTFCTSSTGWGHTTVISAIRVPFLTSHGMLSLLRIVIFSSSEKIR